jgi:hypothetical protein
MKENYSEMCETLNNDYFSSLRCMLIDIIHEKSIFKNYRYIQTISRLVREINHEIQKNSLVSVTHKVLAIALGWFPIPIIIGYKIRRV